MYLLFQRLIYDFQGNIGGFEPKHLLKVDRFVENDSRDLTSFVAKKVVILNFLKIALELFRSFVGIFFDHERLIFGRMFVSNG